ncbi:uncharacterized protein LOC135493341 [Lineus longissimus]|uniref:uncharacterized protein LOC135493341 n=1 Tax=Lineus longissimus TaxID=88925 RepID=UPI00315CAEA4
MHDYKMSTPLFVAVLLVSVTASLACKGHYTPLIRGECMGHNLGSMIHGERHPGCRARCDDTPGCRGYWFKVDMPGRRLRCQLKSAMCNNAVGAGERQMGRMWQREGCPVVEPVVRPPPPAPVTHVHVINVPAPEPETQYITVPAPEPETQYITVPAPEPETQYVNVPSPQIIYGQQSPEPQVTYSYVPAAQQVVYSNKPESSSSSSSSEEDDD